MEVIAGILQHSYDKGKTPPQWALAVTASAAGAHTGAIRELQQVNPMKNVLHCDPSTRSGQLSGTPAAHLLFTSLGGRAGARA